MTLADALIAQTGSVFVSASCGGRGASVVAPCHIVYATTKQLVPDLVTALRTATAQGRLDKNSFACIISGSSRTADIEKILVQGAHGPMRLVVIVETVSSPASDAQYGDVSAQPHVLVNFPHGQEKSSAQKEDCQQEETNPQKEAGSKEEASEEDQPLRRSR